MATAFSSCADQISFFFSCEYSCKFVFFLFVQNNLEDVFSFAMEMLSEEAQPSVRLMVEWISVLLLLRHPHLRRHLWESLKRGSEKKAACLCSLHSIVMHLSKLITDPLEKVKEWASISPKILSYTHRKF